jgi:transcriptional regulator with XRE-family HTH domain
VTAGEKLKKLRERFGMTLRDVEEASNRLASLYNNSEFAIPASRLSDIEAKGMVPSLFRLYSLAVIYRSDIRDILEYFGINVHNFAADIKVANPTITHLIPSMPVQSQIKMPTAVDVGFNLQKTGNLCRLIEQWGSVPLAFLEDLEKTKFVYAFLGTDDYTMYPLIPPGSFLQIDQTKTTITMDRQWRSEYERPIYFLETRDGYICSWCSKNGSQIMVQPHPLSSVAARALRHPQEIEVVGQVIGVALRLQQASHVEHEQSSKENEASSRSGLKLVH